MCLKTAPHTTINRRIVTSSRYSLLALFLVCGLVVCSKPTDSKDAWDWYRGERTVQFLSNDWRYAAESYTAGDSLTIAVVDWIGPSVEENDGGTGLLISANADTERVYLFQRVLIVPASYGILQRYGSKHATAYSQTPVQYNGILEIKGLEEQVILFYRHSYPLQDPLPVLSDTTMVKR